MFSISDSKGGLSPVRSSDREAAIERVINAPRPVGDQVIWEGGRVVAVIRSEGGDLPAIITPR